jgi:hypothetical protein
MFYGADDHPPQTVFGLYLGIFGKHLRADAHITIGILFRAFYLPLFIGRIAIPGVRIASAEEPSWSGDPVNRSLGSYS